MGGVNVLTPMLNMAMEKAERNMKTIISNNTFDIRFSQTKRYKSKTDLLNQILLLILFFFCLSFTSFPFFVFLLFSPHVNQVE